MTTTISPLTQLSLPHGRYSLQLTSDLFSQNYQIQIHKNSNNYKDLTNLEP